MTRHVYSPKVLPSLYATTEHVMSEAVHVSYCQANVESLLRSW